MVGGGAGRSAARALGVALAAVLATALAKVSVDVARPRTDRAHPRTSHPAAASAAFAPAPPGAADADVERVYRHLSRVHAELASAGVSGVTDEHRRRRARTLAWLAEYRDARVYPHNHVRPEGRVPVFVDPHGTPCAVAYLLLRAGAGDLVADVAARANLATVHELASDPRLEARLADLGLTVDEAARIQPHYGPTRPVRTRDDRDVYKGATIALSMGSFALAAFNGTARPARGVAWSGVAGVATGLAHAGLFGGEVGQDRPRSWIVGVNAGFAALATALGVRRIVVAETPPAGGVARRPARRALTLEPAFAVEPGGALVVGARLRR